MNKEAQEALEKVGLTRLITPPTDQQNFEYEVITAKWYFERILSRLDELADLLKSDKTNFQADQGD